MGKADSSSKFLIANLSKSWGGGEKWMFSVGKGLLEKGYAIEYLVYPHSELCRRLDEAGMPYQTLGLRTLSLLNPLKMLRLRQILTDIRPAAILLNSSHELKTVAWMAKQAGVSEIIFRRGVSYPISDNLLNRWLLKHFVTRFLANSRATFEAFVKTFPFILDKPNLSLNNGIDPRDWTPNPEAMVSGRIACSARLSPEKGLERAIKAMTFLPKISPSIQLWIMGEGPEKSDLQRLASELGIEDRIHFEGFVEHIQPLLQTCSIFVFTPHFGEGTSLALIEAMLLELPCVVMDTAAMREVVLDGETGFVVPDGDVRALADRLAQLIQDPALRDRLGKAGRERALQEFSLAYIVDQVEEWLFCDEQQTSSI